MVLGGVSKILIFAFAEDDKHNFQKKLYPFGFFLQLENEIENEMVPGLVFSNRKVFFSSCGLVAHRYLLTCYQKPQRIRHSMAFTTTKTFQWRLRTFDRWAFDA